MYLKIGLIVAAITFVFLSLPILEVFIKWAKSTCKNFINDTKSDEKIEPIMFGWFYQSVKKKCDRKYLGFTGIDYYGPLVVALVLCLLIPFIWPVVVLLGFIFVILIILRKIKRFEKLLKSTTENKQEKKDVWKEEK